MKLLILTSILIATIASANTSAVTEHPIEKYRETLMNEWAEIVMNPENCTASLNYSWKAYKHLLFYSFMYDKTQDCPKFETRGYMFGDMYRVICLLKANLTRMELMILLCMATMYAVVLHLIINAMSALVAAVKYGVRPTPQRKVDATSTKNLKPTTTKPPPRHHNV